jgi:hypothetical protein
VKLPRLPSLLTRLLRRRPRRRLFDSRSERVFLAPFVQKHAAALAQDLPSSTLAGTLPFTQSVLVEKLIAP